MSIVESEPQFHFDITKASVSDVPAIVTLHSEVFVATHERTGPGLTEEVLYKNVEHPMSVQIRTRRYGAAIASPSHEVYIAQEGNTLIGFGISSTDDKGKKTLDSLYIDPKYQRRRVGSSLLSKIIDPKKDLYLWVGENTSAIGFYNHLHFEFTGKTTNAQLLDTPEGIHLLQMKLPSKRLPPRM